MKSVFLKASMVILGLLLCVNLVVSFFGSPATSYAAKNFQYKIINLSGGNGEAKLNQYGSQGWEVVAISGADVILKK
jgi:hypothetical protein